MTLAMAAIMALIFVPALFAVGLIVLTNLDGSLVAATGSVLFALLAIGIFVGLLKLARRWENETL